MAIRPGPVKRAAYGGAAAETTSPATTDPAGRPQRPDASNPSPNGTGLPQVAANRDAAHSSASFAIFAVGGFMLCTQLFRADLTVLSLACRSSSRFPVRLSTSVTTEAG